jgi:hypothetical protein
MVVLGMVAYTCNLSYSGDRDWEEQGARPAWQKLVGLHLNQ